MQSESEQRHVLSAMITPAAPERWALRTYEKIHIINVKERISEITNRVGVRPCTHLNCAVHKLQNAEKSDIDTHLLNKGTSTSINHQNEWRFPFFHFAGGFVSFATRVSLRRIDVSIAQIGIGVINILSDRTTVWWNSKESLSMVVPILFEKFVWDLSNSSSTAKHCGNEEKC